MVGERILVVEDNPAHRELLRDLLQTQGYQVHEAVSGPEALSLVKSLLPDLVIMDLRLPGADGLAVTRSLKEDAQTEPIPVIALTAYTRKYDETRAYQAGCQAFASKPVDTRAFARLIASILSQRRRS